MYDNNSDIFGFIYNDTEYYYIKNAQNDVIGIADADGNVLVKYFYDAWGKIILITDGNDNDITNLENDISHGIFDITTGESKPVLDENSNPVTEASTSVILARINPILYRSYYYDKETEWYYLNSRFYNPEFCRFINSDDSDIIDGGNDHILENNLFIYCFNNPVNLTDDDGTWPSWATKVAIGAGAILIGAAAIAITAATGGVAAPAAAALFLQTAAIGTSTAIASAASSAAISVGISATYHRISTGSWDGVGKVAADSAIDGAATGFMIGGIFSCVASAVTVVKHVKIEKIGKMKPANKSGKTYYGVKFKNKRGSIKSFELHSPHVRGPHSRWHWQLNTWNPRTNGITGKSKHWTFWGKRF